MKNSPVFCQISESFQRLTLLLFSIISFSHLAIGQDYWQQRVEYEMEIDFDVKQHQFDGRQVLKYTNNSPDTLHRVFYHLYLNAFQPNSMMDVRSRTIVDPDRRVMDRISKLDETEIGFQEVQSLTQDGKALEFHVEQTVLEVELDQPIPPGSESTFEMTFNAQVPLQIRRCGRFNSEGIEYSMSQWFPKMAEYDERGWHAHPYVAREFYAPWGDYDVTITIDKDYVVAGTGVLQNPNEIGHGYEDEGIKVKHKSKKLSWKFKAENVHDFVWAADPDYQHVKTKVPDGPILHFFYQKGQATKEWENLPELTVKAFQFIEENFGEYPFPQYSVIQGGDGGMEYPMATLITGHRPLRSLVGVTVHEALHSWYQGLLATNESYYAWIDEGFVSYTSSLTMAHLFDETVDWQLDGNYRGYFALAMSGREEPMSTHADHFQTNFAYGRAAYSKGAVSLAQLGYVIGEEKRDQGLLRFFNEWKFKHPDLVDFVRVMEKTSELELDWYYEYWVNTTHTIDYAVDTIVSLDQERSEVVLRRIQQMPMPIDLWVTKTNGERLIYYIPLGIMRGEKSNDYDVERIISPDWSWTHPTYRLGIDIPFNEIKSIEIDSSGLMADIDRSNNLLQVAD